MIEILKFEYYMQDDIQNFVINNMKKELNIKSEDTFFMITKDLNNIKENYIKNGGEFLIAYDNELGEIIGTIAMKFENKIPILKRFYVLENYREKKIGFLLYKSLEEQIKFKNISEIYLVSGKKLINAHKFYEKNGWKIEYNNPGIFVREGAYLYKKNLI